MIRITDRNNEGDVHREAQKQNESDKTEEAVTYTSKGSTFSCKFGGSPQKSPPRNPDRSRVSRGRTLGEAASCSLYLKSK